MLAAYVTLQNIETIAHVAGVLPGAGGIGLDATVEDPAFSGLRRATSVPPGSPAALAGIVPGDLVRTDPPWLPIGYALAGQRFAVTLVQDGHVRRAVLTAQPHDTPDLNQLRGLDLNALEVERLEALAERQRGEIAALSKTVEAIGRMRRATR